MKESTPMKVVAVDEDGVAELRPLSLLERLAYHTAYGAGAIAAAVVNAADWLAAVLGFRRG